MRLTNTKQRYQCSARVIKRGTPRDLLHSTFLHPLYALIIYRDHCLTVSDVLDLDSRIFDPSVFASPFLNEYINNYNPNNNEI